MHPPRTLEWVGDTDGFLRLIDQTLLPTSVEYRDCRTVEEVWEAIRVLRVRGAPAIGVAAAYGVVVGVAPSSAASRDAYQRRLKEVTDYLRTSRPTAVNLFWALERMEKHAATRSLAVANLAPNLAGRHVWVCIGNRDDRVNTDDAIAFTRKLVAASPARDQAVPVELHVMPTVGHRIHDTAHEEVAAWVLKCMKGAG